MPGEGVSNCRDVRLVTADGVCLEASHWSAGGPDPALATVVLVHGFSSHRDHPDIRAAVAELGRAGLAVLAYDARGHGASGGTCGVGSTEHADVACATREALSATAGPVVLLGVSMGAVAVVHHLADPAGEVPDRVAGAVLVSAPARWRMRPSPVGVLTAGLTRTAPGRWAAARWIGVRVARGWRVGEEPEGAAGRLRRPLAVVHGEADRLIPAGHAGRIRRAAGGPTHLTVVPGMGHGLDPLGRAAAVEAVQWVLGRAAGGDDPRRPRRVADASVA